MVSSRVYPGLERSPGRNDNWVEATGGLPSYIERIAKHLHYERGYTISNAIATAVNTVKRWARGGTVTKSGTTKRVSKATQAKAAAALASWERKKAQAKARRVANLATPLDERILMIDLSYNMEMVRNAFGAEEEKRRVAWRKRHPYKPGAIDTTPMYPYRYVKEVWSDYLIIQGENGKHFKIPYKVDEKNNRVQFGTEVEVKPTFVELASSVRTCSYCDSPATKSVVWNDGKSVVTVCPGHVANARKRVAMLKEKVEAVNDLATPFKTELRRRLAAKGEAMPDGSFPIRNVADLRNAIRAIGRAKNPAAAKRHIIKRARALNATNLLPQTWNLSVPEDVAIDLAKGLTKDGRPSFRNQGKWKHGFIPVDKAAKESKAKGSPIAMKRMNRLYGDVKPGLKATRGGVTEKTSTGRVATSRRALTPESKATQRLALLKNNAERSRGGGQRARSTRPWNQIPEAQKVVRNGKRYVLAVYRGQQQLVEWTGSYARQNAPDPSKRVLRSITETAANQLTTAQIRRLLKVPGQPPNVKKVLNKVLREKVRKLKTGRAAA